MQLMISTWLAGLAGHEPLLDLLDRSVDALSVRKPVAVGVAGVALLVAYRAVRRLVRLAWLVAAALLLASSWAAAPRGGVMADGRPAAGGAGLPAADTAAASPPPPPTAWPARVVRVVDGDTLEAEVGVPGSVTRTAAPRRTLRLLRVDAPELASGGQSDGHPTCLAATAVRRLSALVPVGSVVTAAHDVEPRDRYGRDLVHLWTVDGVWVNGALLRSGYARLLTVPPNLGFDGAARAAEYEARRAARGLWRARACG